MSSENTFHQTLSGHQGDSKATGDPSAMWPTVEPMGPAWPSPQQPFPLQPGSYPAGGDLGQTGVPVPLYSVPETHLPGIGGGMAVTEAPGGRAWEEAQRTHPAPGKTCARWQPGMRSFGVEEEDEGRQGPVGSWRRPERGCAYCVSALVLELCQRPREAAPSVPLSPLLGQAEKPDSGPSCPPLGSLSF